MHTRATCADEHETNSAAPTLTLTWKWKRTPGSWISPVACSLSYAGAASLRLSWTSWRGRHAVSLLHAHTRSRTLSATRAEGPGHDDQAQVPVETSATAIARACDEGRQCPSAAEPGTSDPGGKALRHAGLCHGAQFGADRTG